MTPAARLLVCTALIAGCAGAPRDHFYTLVDANPPSASDAGTSVWSIAVGPVAVPEVVDRPQLVIRTGNQRLSVLESRRWAQSLSREIGGAVAADLNRAIPRAHAYLDEGEPPQLEASPAIRVALRVDRFESRLDESPGVDDVVYWAVRCGAAAAQASGETRSGVSQLHQDTGSVLPGGDPYEAVVAAHARALSELSTTIAAAVNDIRLSCR